MVWTRADGCATAAIIAAANISEHQLLESLLDSAEGAMTPEVLLADRAYDDALRDRLAERGIFLLSPHRKKPPRHDGRHLRRYPRRYVVERTNAWLQAF